MNRNWMKWNDSGLWTYRKQFIFCSGIEIETTTQKRQTIFVQIFSIVSLSKLNWTITECCAFEQQNCAFVDVCVCVCVCLNVLVGILLFIFILQFFSTNLLFVWMFPFFLVCSTFRQTHIDLYKAMICCWWCRFLPFYHTILLYCALYYILVMGWVFYLLKKQCFSLSEKGIGTTDNSIKSEMKYFLYTLISEIFKQKYGNDENKFLQNRNKNWRTVT